MAEHTVVLALAVEIGTRLQESGAEIYRVEEAVRRVFQAYGVDGGQVYAIPHCLIVSVIDNDGRPISRMRRIQGQDTDVTRMEQVYGFCRRVCQNSPDPDAALAQLRAMDAGQSRFPFWLQLAAYFLATGSFTLFFGGGLLDGLAGGLCGAAICLSLAGMERLGANAFVRTVLAAFLSAFLAAILARLAPGLNANYITIGALMALTPGLMLTNCMRDMMGGDTVAGLIKLAQALLAAAAIAIGAFLAMALAAWIWGG